MLTSTVVAADSVRRLAVAIVLLTNGFNKTLTPAEIERVHEEVVEFHAFYQRHGAGTVDFDFSLIQVDRRVARSEVAEVSPGRHYLSREALAAELAARGFAGRFDEVIALHAWSNANPERAVQAYGGGAVGPDGHFLGDAGFNSIPVMARDPNTIGQVLIHEVLHNLDDMFSRSGLPDAFLNSDEMSRNMAQLLRERPGAFLPRYTDQAMLAYAERERQGREAYPWAMQLVYYGWMLERTPKDAWDRLRYGRMVPAEPDGPRALYSTVYTSAANDAVYLPVLGPVRARARLNADPLRERRYEQADFDGTTIASGAFAAAWVRLPPAGDTVAVRLDWGQRSLPPVVTRVIRQRVAAVVAPEDTVIYVESVGRPPAFVVRADRAGGPGPALEAAVRLDGLPPRWPPATGTYLVSAAADLPGWTVQPARVRLVVRRSWELSDDGPLSVALGAPVTLNAFVRESRARDDAAVTATLAGRPLALARTGDGRYSVTVTEELPFGDHWARLRARAADGTVLEESVRVYVRPAGWIQVPDSFPRDPAGLVRVSAALRSRMGVLVRQPVPLVAVAGDRVVPLQWEPGASRYQALFESPASVERVVVTSLVGDPQRRDVRLVPGPRWVPPATGAVAHLEQVDLPPFAAAVRLERPPAVDADLDDWPATDAPGVTLSSRAFLLTDPDVYHGDADLSGTIRFGWDDSTLYVAGELVDDSVTGGDAWDTDRVNLVFDMKDDTSPLTYDTPNPPLDRWQDDDYWLFWRFGGDGVRRFGRSNADPVPGARLATRRTARGWSFEAAIPRQALPGYVPFPGQVSGLQVFVTDGDGERTATEVMWTARWPYTADGLEWRLAELAHLLFTDAHR